MFERESRRDRCGDIRFEPQQHLIYESPDVIDIMDLRRSLLIAIPTKKCWPMRTRLPKVKKSFPNRLNSQIKLLSTHLNDLITHFITHLTFLIQTQSSIQTLRWIVTVTPLILIQIATVTFIATAESSLR